MIVTENTKYEDFARWECMITSNGKEAITDASARVYIGEEGFFSLTIAQLSSLMRGEFEGIKWQDDGSVFSKYFIDGLKDFLEKFIELLKIVTPKPTGEELMASQKCNKIDFIEGLLVFGRSYFGLHSFAEASNITLGELIIAKRDEYNKYIFNKSLANIQRNKMKSRK